MLIAASRGYDLLNDGDAQDNVTLGDANAVDAAKEVLKAANDKVGSGDKVADAALFDKMNEADLNSLINGFKTNVDTSSGGGLWDKILCAVGACLSWITRYLGFSSYIVGICIFAVR